MVQHSIFHFYFLPSFSFVCFVVFARWRSEKQKPPPPSMSKRKRTSQVLRPDEVEDEEDNVLGAAEVEDLSSGLRMEAIQDDDMVERLVFAVLR